MTNEAENPHPENIRQSIENNMRILYNDVIWHNLNGKDLEAGIDEAKQAFSGYPEFVPQALDYLAASKKFEELNTWQSGFAVYLGKEARKRGIEPAEITRKDFDDIIASCPYIADQTGLEDGLMKMCQGVTKEFWQAGKFATDTDALLMINDLKYRQARRIPEAKEREAKYAELEAEMIRLVRDIGTKGGKAEYILIYLLRQLAREKKNDHLLEVRHGSLREDMNKKIDVMVMIGDQGFNLQMKGYPDAHTEEYQEYIQRQTEQDLRGSNIKAWEIDQATINDIDELARMLEFKIYHPWSEEDEKKYIVLRSKILRAMFASGEVDKPDCYELLATVQRKKQEKRGSYFKPKWAETNINFKVLTEYGYLDGPIADVRLFQDKKREFIAYMSSLPREQQKAMIARIEALNQKK